MNKPTIKQYEKPTKLSQYPQATCFEAGHLVDINAGWRNERPVIAEEKCRGCMQCYMYCPDGVICRKGEHVDIDYDFCKGCGICVKICPFGAITMCPEC